MKVQPDRKTYIKQAILIGDYHQEAPYHPLEPIEKEIRKLMPEGWELHVTDDYDMFTAERLEAYDLCISYTDTFDKKFSVEHTAGIISYVVNGGGLLIIHAGVSMQEQRHEMKLLMGAVYRGHTDYQQLDMCVSSPSHPIMKGISSFSMDEEPYEFSLLSAAERTILMEYNLDGTTWPAAWCSQYGLGRIVYLMPGHHAASFEYPEYRKVVVQSMLWGAGLDTEH